MKIKLEEKSGEGFDLKKTNSVAKPTYKKICVAEELKEIKKALNVLKNVGIFRMVEYGEDDIIILKELIEDTKKDIEKADSLKKRLKYFENKLKKLELQNVGMQK